jgi:uncharacterized protein (TIGR02001 family)
MLKAVLPLLLLAAVPARAEDPFAGPALRWAGGVQIETDARFRGVSQSDLLPAIGGRLTVEHRSGLYLGGDIITVAGWGAVGGAPVRVRLDAGYLGDLAGARIDAGVTWYLYPGGAAPGGFVETRADLSGTLGPVTLSGGLAWAPPQTALGNWSGTPQSQPGSSGSNLYLRADLAAALIGTPLTLVGHVGHSQGSEGLGPQHWALSPTGAYWDWRLGVDYVDGPFTLGLAWLATDINPNSLAWRQLQPAFSANGGPIGGGQFVATVSASF